MLVQDWLRQNNGDFVLLNKQLGIDTTFHPTDERVILNYSQIDSPKTNGIVRECRALTLNKNDFSLIARGFPRFFNYGENPENDKAFRWQNSIMQEKLDGSLILCFYWNNDWHVQTRASYGYGEINGIIWRELFDLAMPKHWRISLPQYRHGRVTYVFELCSRYNKVVRDYPSPVATLLTMYDGEWELQPNYVDVWAQKYGLSRPNLYYCESFEEVKATVDLISQRDKTFEGFVLRDEHGTRIKIKSESYFYLHRLVNNGNGFLPKNLIPLLLMGEADELKIYWKEQVDKIIAIEDRLNKYRTELTDIWAQVSNIESQKEFALKIKDNRLSPFLFSARKLGKNPVDLFNKNPEIVLKLFE